MVIKGGMHTEYQVVTNIGDVPVEQVKEFIYLRFYVNEKLTDWILLLLNYQEKFANLKPGCPFSVAEKMFVATVGSTAIFGAKLVVKAKNWQFHIEIFQRIFRLKRSTLDDAM